MALPAAQRVRDMEPSLPVRYTLVHRTAFMRHVARALADDDRSPHDILHVGMDFRRILGKGRTASVLGALSQQRSRADGASAAERKRSTAAQTSDVRSMHVTRRTPEGPSRP
jgi:hypothetical protein